MKLEINLPNFIGFYESPLDNFEISNDIESYGDVTQEQYDQIDWKATHKAISNLYLNKFWEQNKDSLKTFGINSMVFKSIDSPKFYNYSTDELVLDVTFNKTVFRKSIKTYIKTNWSAFELYVKDKYSDRPGFWSFYTNDANEWITDLLKDKLDDNVVFEGFLEFIMNTNEVYNVDDIHETIYETKYELLEYLETV